MCANARQPDHKDLGKLPSTAPAVDDVWEDLVVSILSVNQYSLERTYSCIDGLRQQGITNPENLIRWDQSEIARRLVAAGCDRGAFMTNLFAVRLCNLGMAVEAARIETFAKTLSGENRDAMQTLLLPIKGVGPKVISNFFLLRSR